MSSNAGMLTKEESKEEGDCWCGTEGYVLALLSKNDSSPHARFPMSVKVHVQEW